MTSQKIFVIRHFNDFLELVFVYNEDIVKMIKSIESSSFNKDKKRWYVHVNSLTDLITFCKNLGYELVCDIDLNFLADHSNAIEPSQKKFKASHDSEMRYREPFAEKSNWQKMTYQQHGHKEDEIMAIVNFADESMAINLPMPKNIYGKLKSSNAISWKKDQWWISKEDRDLFNQECKAYGFKIINE